MEIQAGVDKGPRNRRVKKWQGGNHQRAASPKHFVTMAWQTQACNNREGAKERMQGLGFNSGICAAFADTWNMDSQAEDARVSVRIENPPRIELIRLQLGILAGVSITKTLISVTGTRK
jgi:hypothetical protein